MFTSKGHYKRRTGKSNLMGMLLPFVYINIILIVVRHTLAKHINIYISETTSSYVFSIKHHAKLNGEQCFNMQDKIAPFYISSHTCHLRLIDGHFLDYEKRQRYDILVGIRGNEYKVRSMFSIINLSFYL